MSDYYDGTPDYDDLAARLDRLEDGAQELQYEPDEEINLAQYYAAESMQDGQTARDYLASVAEQTRQAVLAESGVDPSYTEPARNPVEAAVEMVAATVPTWEQDAPAVQEYLSQSGVDLGPVLATGDPTAIAKVLYSAQMHVKLNQTARQTKNAAQTMSGSNSSREAETYWDQIKAARGMPSFRV